MLKKRLSIIIPAFNEAGNIKAVVKKVSLILLKYCSNYQIIIINDGSTDGTGKIADKLAQTNKKIDVIHNLKNEGMGFSYFKGVEQAKFEYLILIFGDNDHPLNSIEDIISKVGKADIIIPFYTNFHLSKTWLRHLISVTYIHLVNYLSGLKIGYYNGITLYKTELVRNLPTKSAGFGFQAEMLVYLLKKGASYIIVNTSNDDRKSGSSAAFKFKNIIRIIRSLLSMYFAYKYAGKSKN